MLRTEKLALALAGAKHVEYFSGTLAVRLEGLVFSHFRNQSVDRPSVGK